MYKIDNVIVDGFWQRFGVEGKFNHDVNIIIGKNGTGKTTFMNALHSVLAVDIEGLANADFQSVEIRLSSYDKKVKTIKVKISDDDSTPFTYAEYQISSTKYRVRLISMEDRRFSAIHRRKMLEETEALRRELDSLVSLSSLSVYRLRNGEHLDPRERNSTHVLTPVDFRLKQLLAQLTTYQLELSQEARHIAAELQKDVLGSILYSPESPESLGFNVEFDKEEEKSSLVSAYKQLNAYDSSIKKKINVHVEGIDKTINMLNEARELKENEVSIDFDFSSIQALASTKKIIKLSLEAEKKTSYIFEPIALLTKTLSSFITDKKFDFVSGELIASNKYDRIQITSLSSGEKQLLILFIETTLQKNKDYIFLTDEPELSLHISWQRKILPAVKEINPNAQIIAATHSPEVASKYRGAIIDMERMIHG
ncbi:AAA family ATPase [Vibrio splendidus]